MSSMKLMVVSTILMVLLIVIPVTKALTCQCSNNGGTLGYTGPMMGTFTPFLQCYTSGDTCAVAQAGDNESIDCCTCCCGATNTPSDFHGDTAPFETSEGCPPRTPGGD